MSSKNIRNVYISHDCLECEPPIHGVLIVYQDGSKEYINEMSYDDIWSKYRKYMAEGYWNGYDKENPFDLFGEIDVKPTHFNKIPSPDPNFS